MVCNTGQTLRSVGLSALVLVLGLIVATPVRAQQSAIAGAGDVAASSAALEAGQGSGPQDVIVQQATGPIEQVIVTGQRTYNSLINEAARETESFYMRLNEVLDNDDYRIRCQTETPPGTSIATRVCRTRYQEELLSRQAVSVIQGAGNDDDGNLTFSDNNVLNITPDMYRKNREFAEEMLIAVNADPQLNASVVRLLQLKAAVQNYETPRQQRRRERQEAEQAED